MWACKSLLVMDVRSINLYPSSSYKNGVIHAYCYTYMYRVTSSAQLWIQPNTQLRSLRSPPCAVAYASTSTLRTNFHHTMSWDTYVVDKTCGVDRVVIGELVSCQHWAHEFWSCSVSVDVVLPYQLTWRTITRARLWYCAIATDQDSSWLFSHNIALQVPTSTYLRMAEAWRSSYVFNYVFT